jgi:hypothetical protein
VETVIAVAVAITTAIDIIIAIARHASSNNSQRPSPQSQFQSLPEGVGKSSLISTYVSRYFSEFVPGIMTNAVLPPSETDSKCITRIVDSQQGDQALISEIQTQTGDSTASLTSYVNTSRETSSSASPPPTTPTTTRVDAIILVYDLNRIETFYRLESHWLPLIERRYQGEVSLMSACIYVCICACACHTHTMFRFSLSLSDHCHKYAHTHTHTHTPNMHTDSRHSRWQQDGYLAPARSA